MAIYALADLHLCLSCPDKSMAIFWPAWEDYVARIKENWENTVTEEDTVLVPGDISWATYIDEAEEDFRYLSDLPGRKLLCRGNHDYMREFSKLLIGGQGRIVDHHYALFGMVRIFVPELIHTHLYP